MSVAFMLRTSRTRLGARFLPAAVLLSAALAPGTASAQTGTLDTYVAAPTPEDDFQIARPTDLGHLRFGAALHLDYALNPLIWEDKLGDSSTERLAIVQHQLGGTLALSLGLFDRLVVYGGVPVVLLMSGAGEDRVNALGPAPADGSSFGDVNLGLRLRLLGRAKDSFVLGTQVTVMLPTSSGQYSGDAGLAAVPMMSAEIRGGGGVRLVLNAGVRARARGLQTATNVEFGNELLTGAGLAVPVWTDDDESHLDLHGQVNGGSGFRDFFGREATHAELLGGVKLNRSSGFVLGAEAGPGITRGIGTPDLRAVVMTGWVSPVEKPPAHPCAATPEDKDGFQDGDGCDDPDNDADGFLDKVDACPNEPETKNGWEDTDGCPDAIPDTDGDGLLDPQDKCPKEPEDFDKFQDEDGCPDPDNDADGVLDVNDACVMEPGIVENRGCPDKDRDVDTVIDRRDNCPDVPGPAVNFGCPEKQQVKIEAGFLEVLDIVYFRTDSDEILAKSFSLLNNVVSVMTAHPEIEKIVVEGHTDNRGAREHNVDLSRRRAAAVATYLKTKGVDEKRLESVGYGPDKPVVENAKTKADHAKNRRVVFKIVGGPEGLGATDSGPAKEHIDR